MNKLKFLISVVACVAVLTCTVSAAKINSTPYLGYEFNNEDKSVPAPVGFELQSASYDRDMRFEKNLGTAKSIYYCGNNTEKQYTLILTDRYVIKADTSYNVVAHYAIDGCGRFESIAMNPINGYIFASVGGNVLIYNTNGKFIKSVTAAQAGSGFYARGIVNTGYDEENTFAVLSGKSIVFLDGEGNISETVKLDAEPIDIYYSPAAEALYLLTADSVIDNTNETIYKTGMNFSGKARFVSDTTGDNFYIADGGTVFRVGASDEAAERLAVLGNVCGIAYNAETDKPAVLSADGALHIAEYNGNELVKEVKDYAVSFNNPADILYDGKEFIYILDSGNGRVIKTDSAISVIKDIYESFTDGKEKLDMTGAQGFWIDGGRLIIADTEHERVLVSDFAGNVSKMILKPTELKGLKAPFRASKVLTDRNGRLYVIAESVNMGAFVFTKDYKYEHFFGSNNVLTTAEAIYNYIRKLFLNKSQKSALQSNTPITLSNFDVDDNDFIYVVTKTDQKLVNSNFSSTLRKINYIGSDILGDNENKLKFGDLEWDREKKVTNTSFIDVDVSPKGWITALDGIRGKVFQYSPEGELIAVFGGTGTQYGFVNSPTALETVGENIYVIDSYYKCVNIYKPTDYVAALHDAFSDMDTTDLDATVAKWNKVLSMNSNNSYAYYGLGVAYENAGEYEKAMENFKIANAKEQYSKAYKEYRKTYLDEHLIMIIAVIAAAVIIVAFAAKKLSAAFVVPENGVYAPIESKAGMPLYVLLHPADGFAQFRARGVNSTLIAIGIAIALFFIKILEYFKQGFIFNSNKPVNYSLVSTLFGTVVIYALFVISNLAIASFLDGKGNLKQIAALTSYSLIPLLTAMLINIGLSNILALDEEIFMSIILVIGVLWSTVLIIVGSVEVHEYSFGKTLLSLLLTVIAMLIFIVLSVLLFSLVKELISFVKSVVYEISLR